MTQRTDTYDVELLMVIDERDAFEAWADRLANAIGEHLGIDIGEHTSSNIPWYNALEAIQGAPKPPASAQSVEPVAMVRKLVNMSIIDSTGCKTSWEDLPDGTKLYTSPPVSAQSVEPVAVAIHHVKLKTRKRIDAEIPRTMQGWWAVCPGKRMVLRDAHAADIARYHIDEGQSRDPKDYLCELSDTGWLVARIAIDTIRTEMVPVGVITDAKSADDVRDAALEEAARLCEEAGTLPTNYIELGRGVAYAIRALKLKKEA